MISLKNCFTVVPKCYCYTNLKIKVDVFFTSGHSFRGGFLIDFSHFDKIVFTDSIGVC